MFDLFMIFAWSPIRVGLAVRAFDDARCFPGSLICLCLGIVFYIGFRAMFFKLLVDVCHLCYGGWNC